MSKLFELESRDIVDYLERHGYTAKVAGGHIVVADPVQVHNGRTTVTEYQDTKIPCWPMAVKFVEDRD